MNKETLLQITKKLEGIDYAFISGFAMEVLTNGARKAKDLDIVVRFRDMDRLAGRFGCEPETRKVTKGNWEDVEDCFFNTNFCGQEIEVLSEKYEMKTEGIERLLRNRVKREYLGVVVYVTSVEELIVHKALMMRDKDVLDLKLLVNEKINLDLLKEMSKGRIEHDKLFSILREMGFQLCSR